MSGKLTLQHIYYLYKKRMLNTKVNNMLKRSNSLGLLSGKMFRGENNIIHFAWPCCVKRLHLLLHHHQSEERYWRWFFKFDEMFGTFIYFSEKKNVDISLFLFDDVDVHKVNTKSKEARYLLDFLYQWYTSNCICFVFVFETIVIFLTWCIKIL